MVQDEKLDLGGLIRKLRDITLAVQLTPFVFGGFYVLALALYFFGLESLDSTLDALLYVSPMMVLSLLVFSRILRLCKWHRTACCLPLFPTIFTMIDKYVVEFSSSVIILNLSVLIIMSILLFVSAYKVFFANGRVK